MRLTRAHVLAARGILEMNQETLAKVAGISARTLIRFESGETIPKEETLVAIKEALERRGVVFTNGDKPGVYLDLQKAIIPN